MTVIKKKQSSYKNANVLSKAFFWWITPVLYTGSKNDLQLDDLDTVYPSDEAAALGDTLGIFWGRELIKSPKSTDGDSNKKASLAAAVGKMFGLRYLLLGSLVFVNECFIQMGLPILLGYLTQYFRAPDTFDTHSGLWMAAGVVISMLLLTLIHHTFCFQVMRTGMRVRVACSSLIYSKALKLSQTSITETKVGQIVNMLANDLSRVDQLSFALHYLWVGPTQAVIATIILWHYLGPACLLGLLLIGLYIFMQSFWGRWFSKLRGQAVAKTDGRMGLITEIVNGIRTIKLNAWEELFVKKVRVWRDEELKVVRRTGALRAVNGTLFGLSSKIIIFATILTSVLTGGELTAERVFVSLALYNNVRVIMTLCFPMAVTQLAETIVTFRRIQNFLLLKEVETKSSEKVGTITHAPGITAHNVDIRWGKSDLGGGDGLKGINFVTEGSSNFIGVTGPVGSGKSTLLISLLGETPVCGNLNVHGTLSYAPQEPWLFAGSVKDNILLGKEFLAEWYIKVVNACALKRDFELLPHGDNTMVGEQGFALSGGQKARINLARAVYADSDIVLLDDTFASLDTKVGRHIFENCIQGLLKNKIRVLVTHHKEYLKSADKVLLIKDGHIEYRNGVDLDDITVSTASVDEVLNEKEEAGNSIKESNPNKDEDNEEEAKLEKKMGVWKYFRFIGYLPNIAFILLPNCACVGLLVLADYWLKIWTSVDPEIKPDNKNSTNGANEVFEYLTETDDGRAVVYSLIMLLLLLIYFVRSFAFYNICARISGTVHESLLSSVVATPIRFFEQTSAGRILARFGNDMGVLDDLLPQTMFDTVEIVQNVLAILIVVAVVVPMSLVPVVILLVPFVFLRRFYLKCSRSVKRLEGTARGPILSHLSTSISGITCIRCTPGLDFKLTAKFQTLLDHHSATWITYLATARWIAMWLDILSIVFIACVTFSFFVFSPEGDSAAGFGLVISSSLALTGMLQWGVRQSAEVENQLVSLERVTQYSGDNLQKEGGTIPPKETSPDWPTDGHIYVANMSLRYNENEPEVLKSLNFEINSGEKIGFVGRTGAGKSSILTALLRLVEPEGELTIGGLNIQEIPLKMLRSKVTVIPQSPELFSGTLRSNLDPQTEFSDSDIMRVLKDVSTELGAVGLDMEVRERGANFSVGQRQLLCLARAILKNNKIVILDEATANLDSDTDASIQRLVRVHLKQCTVITIAHRLQSVMDSDRIAVLEAGKLLEFDSPEALLADDCSTFYSMVHQTTK